MKYAIFFSLFCLSSQTLASADEVTKKNAADAETNQTPPSSESPTSEGSEEAEESDGSTKDVETTESAEAESFSAPKPAVTAKPWEGISLESTHEPIEIAGEPYIWLRPGTPLKGTITRKADLGLEALFVRIHKPVKGETDPEKLPPSLVTVTLGEKTEDVPILAPVEVELETEEHPLLLVSYPIVMERALDQDSVALELSVEKEVSPHGIAILLQQAAPPESLPTLELDGDTEESVSDEPEAKPAGEGAEEGAEEGVEEGAEEEDVTPDQQPTDGLIPGTPPDEDTFTSILTARSLDTGIPLRFHVQLELPGSV